VLDFEKSGDEKRRGTIKVQLEIYPLPLAFLSHQVTFGLALPGLVDQWISHGNLRYLNIRMDIDVLCHSLKTEEDNTHTELYRLMFLMCISLGLSVRYISIGHSDITIKLRLLPCFTSSFALLN
jgi:hypothetical protein